VHTRHSHIPINTHTKTHTPKHTRKDTHTYTEANTLLRKTTHFCTHTHTHTSACVFKPGDCIIGHRQVCSRPAEPQGVAFPTSATLLTAKITVPKSRRGHACSKSWHIVVDISSVSVTRARACQDAHTHRYYAQLQTSKWGWYKVSS
jgi:hypothetical protein